MFKVAHFFADGEEEEEEGELLLVVVVEFVNDDGVEAGEEALEEVALVMRAILEHEGIVEDVGVGDENKSLPPVFAGVKFAVVLDEAEEYFAAAHLPFAVEALSDDLLAVLAHGGGRNGDDFVVKVILLDEFAGVFGVLAEEGVGGGDEEDVLMTAV
ncbi:MAG: hypothetical protein D6835_03480 [Candidatus Thermofonsia bacterium]|nr:MAG: hypothetical protein D6835_03480 [Candidatus Thermofonsia bacterium]